MSNKGIFDQMLSRYPMDSMDAHRNATYEVLQQVGLISYTMSLIPTI